jgi:hypothetical protein
MPWTYGSNTPDDAIAPIAALISGGGNVNAQHPVRACACVCCCVRVRACVSSSMTSRPRPWFAAGPCTHTIPPETRREGEAHRGCTSRCVLPPRARVIYGADSLCAITASLAAARPTLRRGCVRRSLTRHVRALECGMAHARPRAVPLPCHSLHAYHCRGGDMHRRLVRARRASARGVSREHSRARHACMPCHCCHYHCCHTHCFHNHCVHNHAQDVSAHAGRAPRVGRFSRIFARAPPGGIFVRPIAAGQPTHC